ncbi:MAG: 16S rRNA (adenine(1518)-N(6)/adenine(1519)-N(6))-dimethyltransferase RsmA [Bifidobacteriaceae bacterium]|jgi:16S rRNA (adenine1518-N6/adenine1519-N6)-dimethyltransferase|nr:16S rRNA (adenine(1518)-N(6)/adenine(1519)-N(6))-dimethyltransferase RsmA [Bifidobacteriaceae bacterium]
MLNNKPKLTQTYISQLSDKLGIYPAKKFGQNFMIDQGTIIRIIKAANVTKQTAVLEIGPGFGALTQHLIQLCQNYLGVEYDNKLFKYLETEYKNPEVKFLHLDAMKLSAFYQNQDNKNSLWPFTKLVANLPYNISIPLLISYFLQFPNLTSATVLVQKEIADRILAFKNSANYGIPAVKLAILANTKKLFNIPPSVFWPRPTVNSCLIQLDKKPLSDILIGDNYEVGLEKINYIFKIIDGAFAHRRKTLASSLAIYFKLPKFKINQTLQQLNIPLNARAQELDIVYFKKIAKLIKLK